MQLMSPLHLYNCLGRWISTSSSAVFFPPLLVFISEEFCLSFRSNCGKTWMRGRSASTLVILSYLLLQSSYEYLSQLSLSRFKAPPNPSQGNFFFCRNRENKLKLRQLLNYLCSEDITCKEAKKDIRFSRNKIHRNTGNLGNFQQ